MRGRVTQCTSLDKSVGTATGQFNSRQGQKYFLFRKVQTASGISCLSASELKKWCMHFVPNSRMLHALPIPSFLVHRVCICWQLTIMPLTVTQFSPAPCYFTHPSQNPVFSTSFPRVPKCVLFRQGKRPNFALSLRIWIQWKTEDSKQNLKRVSL